jgi:phenylpropionate dioxygenase-like ring-hydroxylating dioxygenase large terminal subunit
MMHGQQNIKFNNWYIACVLRRLSAACQQPANVTRTQYTIVVYAAPPEEEQVVLETCKR